MSIHIVCPHCDTDYDVSDDLRGKKIRCRSCKEPILVRAASGIKRNESPAPKNAAPSRRREKDDEDEARPRKSAASSHRREEARPRRKKARADEEPNNHALLWAGGVLCLVLVGVVVVIAVITLRKASTEVAAAKEKELDAVPSAPRPQLPFLPPPQPPSQTAAQLPTQPTAQLPTQPAPQPSSQPAPQDTPEAGRPSSEKVYDRVCRSTVLILALTQFGDEMAVMQGSGTLIDKTNRLVLTNDHVVSGSQAVAVFFQAFDNGRRIGEIRFFMEKLKKSKAEVIEGKVVHTDKSVDLALVQLNRLPPDAQALPIASKSPAVTNSVLSVGHPKGIGGGGLWVHTSGEIRQFQQHRRWRTGNEQQFVEHQADVILTNSQTNPGDSGGPLVNMRAQLVGVTQGGVRDANALSIFIDASEVRQLLKNYEARSGVKLALETQSGVGGDTSSLPKLLGDLGSQDAQVRDRAALALGELGPDAQRAIPALFKVLKDSDENLARDAAQALRAIGAPSRDDLPLLIAGLRDNSPRVRGYAVEALGKMGPEARSAVPNLVQLLKVKETDPELRQQAARCLGQIGAAAATEGVPALSEALKDSEVVVREAAAEALGKFGGQARTAASSLIAVLADKETTVHRAALAALALIGPDAKEALPKLKPAFKDADPEVRRHALDVLGRLGPEAVKDKEALEALKSGLDDMDLCKNALEALARIGPPAKDLAKGLTRHLHDEKHRLAAVAALGSVLEKVKPVPVEAKALRPVLDDLINLFEVHDRDVHTKVVEALGKIGSAAVMSLLQALQKAARNDLPYTRYGVIQALGAIGRDARRKEVITTLSQSVFANSTFL